MTMPRERWLAELCTEGLGVADPAGVIRPCNAALSRQLEAAGGRVRALADLPLTEGQRAELAGWLAGGRREPLELAVELGERRLVWRLGAGSVAGEVALAVRDDTPRAEAEYDVLRLQRVRRLGRLSGAIVHELANQTSSLLGFADELSGEGLRGRDSRFLDGLRQSAQEMAQLLQQVANLVRVGSRRPVRQRLGTLVRNATRPIEKQLLVQGRELSVEGSGDGLVWAHTDVVTQLLLALLWEVATPERADKAVRVRLADSLRRSAGGTGRRYGTVSVDDPEGRLRRLPDQLARSRPVALARGHALLEDAVPAWNALQIHGALLEYDRRSGSGWVDVLLPAAGRTGLPPAGLEVSVE